MREHRTRPNQITREAGNMADNKVTRSRRRRKRDAFSDVEGTMVERIEVSTPRGLRDWHFVPKIAPTLISTLTRCFGSLLIVQTGKPELQTAKTMATDSKQSTPRRIGTLDT
jgi:hypothetical protein